MRRSAALTLQLDASVFDYDSVYDNMQAAKLAAQATRKAESADKKVGALARRHPKLRTCRCLGRGLPLTRCRDSS